VRGAPPNHGTPRGMAAAGPSETTKLKGDESDEAQRRRLLRLIFLNRADPPADSSMGNLESLVGEERKRARHRGCCGAPDDQSFAVSVMLAIFTTMGTVSAGLTIWRCNAEPHLPWHDIAKDLPKSVLGAVIAVSATTAINIIKVPVYRYNGFRDESIALVRGRRDTWTSDTVHGLVREYGERRVKVLDAVFRRTLVIANACFTALTLVVFNDEDDLVGMKKRVVFSFLLVLVMVVLMASFIQGDDACQGAGFVSSTVFASSRIRDGTMARINTLMVQMASYAMLPGAMLCLTALPEATPSGGGDEDTPYGVLVLLAVLTFPMADAMAELVGCFLGRVEFNVYGFGDINKKTVEGVAACWLAAFAVNEIVMHCASSKAGKFPIDSFVVDSVEGLNALLSTVITVVETAAMRGTDDGAGPLAVSCTLLALWRW